MPFPPEERQALLTVKGVGPTVIARLEQMGLASLAHLSRAHALDIVSRASALVGSSCWKNSPQARSAIQAAIAFAQTQTREPGAGPGPESLDPVDALLQDIRLVNELHFQIVSQARRLVLACGQGITEAVKYGGLQFSRGKPFGGLYHHTAHVSMEFSQGASLDNAHGVLEGVGRLRRHIKLRSVEDIQARHLAAHVRAAWARCGDGAD